MILMKGEISMVCPVLKNFTTSHPNPQHNPQTTKFHIKLLSIEFTSYRFYLPIVRLCFPPGLTTIYTVLCKFPQPIIFIHYCFQILTVQVIVDYSKSQQVT